MSPVPAKFGREHCGLEWTLSQLGRAALAIDQQQHRTRRAASDTMSSRGMIVFRLDRCDSEGRSARRRRGSDRPHIRRGQFAGTDPATDRKAPLGASVPRRRHARRFPTDRTVRGGVAVRVPRKCVRVTLSVASLIVPASVVRKTTPPQQHASRAIQHKPFRSSSSCRRTPLPTPWAHRHGARNLLRFAPHQR